MIAGGRYEQELEHVLWDNQNRAQKLTLWKVDASAFNAAEVARCAKRLQEAEEIARVRNVQVRTQPPKSL